MADLARLGIVVDSSQVRGAKGDLAGLSRQGGKTESALSRFGATATRVGKRLSLLFTAPLVAAGGAAIKTAADFESSMTRIETLVGLSADRVAGMREEVLALAGETAQSPRELADALFTVTSAGARGSEAMEILERSAKAAAIGLGETQQIARSTTAVLQAYGKETITAEEATDVLTATVREGNLEASDLAPVLGRVIGIASQLGISFQEVGANIATFTRLGVGAEEAVTGLRGVMNALLKPTSEGAKALDDIGISFEDLRAQVAEEGLASTMIELVRSFEGNEEALSEVIPNVRALSNVLGTAGAQADAYDQIMKNIASTTGIVDEGFARVSETAEFQFAQTLRVLESAAIEVGAALLPMAIQVSNTVEEIITAFRNLDDETQSMALTIAGLLGAGGPVLLAIGAFSSAIAAISAPVAAVLAGVAGAAYLIIQNWDELKEYFTDGPGSEMWDTVQEKIDQVLDAGKAAIGAFVATVEAIWDRWGDDIVRTAEEAFSIIMDTITFFLERTEAVFTAWRQVVEGDVGGALDTIEQDFEVTFDKIYRSVVNYFGEGGLVSDPIFAWFERSWLTTALETLGIIEEEQKKTMDRLMNPNPPEPPEDIIIPADLPSAEELLAGVDLSLGDPIEIPGKVTIEGSNIEEILANTPDAKRIAEPFELLDFALLGLPVSIGEVDEALQSLNEKLLVVGSQDQRDQILALIEDLEDLRDRMKGVGDETGETTKEIEEMDQLGQSLGFTFQSAFEDAIIEGNKLRDVLQGLIDDILRIVIRTQVTKPLAEAFGNFLGSFIGGATGGGGSGGGTSGAARGAIIDSRRTFGMAGGGTLLTGEAGNEAVLPLTRLANGDLGVSSSGGGGSVNVTVINNADGTEARVEEDTKRPDGGRDLTVIIDEITANNIRSGKKSARAIKETFGVSRNPRSRG